MLRARNINDQQKPLFKKYGHQSIEKKLMHNEENFFI